MQIEGDLFDNDESTRSLLSEVISSVPGIDEAMSFSHLIKYIFNELVRSRRWTSM